MIRIEIIRVLRQLGVDFTEIRGGFTCRRGTFIRAIEERGPHVQGDVCDYMILEFEIYIIKVPLLSLHGIQFKRLTGKQWLVAQILRELRP